MWDDQVMSLHPSLYWNWITNVGDILGQYAYSTRLQSNACASIK